MSSMHADALVRPWADILVIYAMLLVLVATLFPYDFCFKDGFPCQMTTTDTNSEFTQLGGINNWFINVFLFLPFGFGLASLTQKRRQNGTIALAAVLGAGIGLSLTIEILQLFLPRDPTLIDILANGVGTLLGFLCFRLWGGTVLAQASVLVEKVGRWLSIKKLSIGFIIYAALAFMISISLQRATSLSNWQQTYPLLLANEQTGDRPWRGHITEVQIADKAVSENEVIRIFSKGSLSGLSKDTFVVSYRLKGGDRYHDQTGHLPDLIWKPNALASQQAAEGLLFSNQWLETAVPPALLTQKIRERSQFTLSTIVATADTAQVGPARIVSLSKNPYRRNFTLGQEEANLVFRLRTPVTGENGEFKPELMVPGVFKDTDPHHLVITYDGSVLRLYIDGLQRFHLFELSPGLVLESQLFSLKTYNMAVAKILYYGLIFIPLGILLALMAAAVKRGVVFFSLLICGGIILPSLMLEGILVGISGRFIRPENLLISMAITASASLIFMGQIRFWKQNHSIL